MEIPKFWKNRGIVKAASLAMAIFAALNWFWRVHLIPSSSIPRVNSALPYSGQRHGQRRFDIVLAHYQETPWKVKSAVTLLKAVPSITELNPRVIVYSKGMEAASNATSSMALKEQLGADILYTLPNVGRESDTYLAHIVEHYDELADHTMFLQAQIENLEGIQGLVHTHFRPSLGVMSFGYYSECSCDACVSPLNGNPDPTYGFKRIPQLYALFNEDFCPPTGLLLSFRGQFMASRGRITRNSKKKWELLRGALTNMSHFIHDDPTPDQGLAFRNDKDPTNPIFGHTLERAWMVIFGCNDLRIRHNCNDRDINAICGCYDVEKEIPSG